MTFNILHAEFGIDAIVDVLRREHGDIICLQEVGRRRPKEPAEDLPRRIADALGGYDLVSASTLGLPRVQSCDIAILSRYPLCEAAAHSLKPGGWVYALSARVGASGRPLHLYSVHTHSTFKYRVIDARCSDHRPVVAQLVRGRDEDGGPD